VNGEDHGPPIHAGVVHSMSKGLSHGNHTGIGLSEKQGAGTSIAVPVPGMQIDALPSDTHGRMLNSVLTMVGHTGTSNGRETGPTLSGGTGMSGRQGRVPPAPKQMAGTTARALTSTTTANRRATITNPGTAVYTTIQKKYCASNATILARLVSRPIAMQKVSQLRAAQPSPLQISWRAQRSSLSASERRLLHCSAPCNDMHRGAFSAGTRTITPYAPCLLCLFYLSYAFCSMVA
jgi:hypothetical protein